MKVRNTQRVPTPQGRMGNHKPENKPKREFPRYIFSIDRDALIKAGYTPEQVDKVIGNTGVTKKARKKAKRLRKACHNCGRCPVCDPSPYNPHRITS